MVLEPQCRRRNQPHRRQSRILEMSIPQHTYVSRSLRTDATIKRLNTYYFKGSSIHFSQKLEFSLGLFVAINPTATVFSFHFSRTGTVGAMNVLQLLSFC